MVPVQIFLLILHLIDAAGCYSTVMKCFTFSATTKKTFLSTCTGMQFDIIHILLAANNYFHICTPIKHPFSITTFSEESWENTNITSYRDFLLNICVFLTFILLGYIFCVRNFYQIFEFTFTFYSAPLHILHFWRNAIR